MHHYIFFPFKSSPKQSFKPAAGFIKLIQGRESYFQPMGQPNAEIGIITQLQSVFKPACGIRIRSMVLV
jgi:hypothetical protein